LPYNKEEEEAGLKYDPNKKIQHFANICSEVLKKFLYISGEKIAYSKEMLKQYGITHIINCAGDACESKFPDEFVYRTYYLKDSKIENIECIFYESFFFIEDALS